ncbi:expressed protein [Echinococcus multilocularis]|uniref:Expressed protein n=1 Tax=Echinococcus multilocularis TaxID=6211 RepID=A0A0S4MMQ5_ECHMU|nr:expressed protein [Echinococcus multilocularis]
MVLAGQNWVDVTTVNACCKCDLSVQVLSDLMVKICVSLYLTINVFQMSYGRLPFLAVGALTGGLFVAL